MSQSHNPPADDFDGIPLEGYVAPTGPVGPVSLCWSCQDSKPLSRLVALGADCLLPCCLACWGKMSVADRLKIARELATYTLQNEANEALRDAMTAISVKLRAIDPELHGGDDDGPPGQFDWLTGRRN